MSRIKKRELLLKSREAMMAAVQIYNNPQITFKSEAFHTSRSNEIRTSYELYRHELYLQESDRSK